jgi:hypothetical protein
MTHKVRQVVLITYRGILGVLQSNRITIKVEATGDPDNNGFYRGYIGRPSTMPG